MTQLFAAMILSISVAVHAAFGIGPESVVMVKSAPCESPQQEYRGSGLLISWGKQQFVLTSNHAVIPGDVTERVCHSIWNEQVGNVPAILKVIEGGNGLAMLQLASPVAEGAEINSKNIAVPEAELPIQVYGYSSGHSQLYLKNTGKISFLRKSPLFPGLPFVLETAQAFGVLGMSGGPVIDKDGKWVGLLSHRLKDASVATDSTVSAITDTGWDAKDHDRLLVIPAEVAFRWFIMFATYGISLEPNNELLDEDVNALSMLDILAMDDGANPIGGADGVGRVGEVQVGRGFVEGLQNHRNRWGVVGENPWHVKSDSEDYRVKPCLPIEIEVASQLGIGTKGNPSALGQIGAFENDALGASRFETLRQQLSKLFEKRTSTGAVIE